MADYFIGIDIGTGSTKAIAVDGSGKTLTTARVAYPTLSPKPSWSEQDPALILAAFKGCIASITNELNTSPVAIGISSAMHSVICVDEDGKALANMIIWADNRSEGIADRLKNSEEGPMLYERGGTPIHAMSPITKIIWFRENDPVFFERTSRFISIKEYIWFHLFGVFEIDYSLASATGLFDIQKLTWNQEALRVAGITPGRLSTPVNTNSAQILGEPILLKELGLHVPTPFIIGASDGCLANLGSLAIHPGIASLTIGTSGAIRIASPTAVVNYGSMPFNYRLDESLFVSGGPINNGGVTLKWYAERFLKRTLATPKDYQELLAQLDEIPAGCDGLVFLPHLLGERAPIWDSSACGAFFGITGRHHQAHFTRAVLEGISMALYQVGKALEDGGLKIDSINVSGGFVHNVKWLQMLADIFGKNICLVDAEDASALGAIYLSRKAMGIMTDYEHLRPAGDVTTYVPDASKNTNYRKFIFPRFQRLYKLLKEEMLMLHQEKMM